MILISIVFIRYLIRWDPWCLNQGIEFTQSCNCLYKCTFYVLIFMFTERDIYLSIFFLKSSLFYFIPFPVALSEYAALYWHLLHCPDKKYFEQFLVIWKRNVWLEGKKWDSKFIFTWLILVWLKPSTKIVEQQLNFEITICEHFNIRFTC
jgi:hypothetical protein